MLQNQPALENFEDSSFLRDDLAGIIQATAEISNKLTAVFDLDELLEKATRLTQQTLGYDQVVLYLLGPDRQQFTLKVIANVNNRQIIRSYPSLNEMSLAYLALRQGRIIRIGNLETEAPSYYQSNPVNIRSELHIPLKRGSRVVGVVSFGCAEQDEYHDDVVIILKTLAAQITIAIDRIRQHSSTLPELAYQDGNQLSGQVQFNQPYNIQNIVPGIQSLARIHEVFDKIVKGVVEGLGYEGAMLAVLDEENLTLPIQSYSFSGIIDRLNLLDKAEKALGIKVIGTSASLIHDPGNLGVQSCLSGEPKITNDLYDLFQPAVDKILCRGLQKWAGVKTCISIPLLVENRVVGNLYAGTKKKEFSERDLDDLRVFVTNAAIAVQNAVLFEQVNLELDSRKAELTQLRGIENMISSSLDLHEVLKRILNGALELTKAEYGQVVLTGKYASGLVRRVSYPEGLDFSNQNKLDITQLVMRDKKPKLIDSADLLEQDQHELEELIDNNYGPYSKMKAHLGVPISLGDELIGVIDIASQEAGAFDKRSLDMLEQLAVQAAIAITNAYRFKEQQEMQRRLSSANQVAAMGDIAGNMVHSINNWVGSIRADAKYLISHGGQSQIDRGETLEILEDVLNNAEKTLSKAERIRQPFQLWTREPIDINECVQTALLDSRKELTDLSVIKDLQDIPYVMATQQLEQVFDNLIKNAVQAMDGQTGSVLEFATRCSTDGQHIEIIVKDSGPGLSDSIDETDIFKLGKSGRQDGMGYGLWWCDTYLKRIEGDIRLIKNTSTGCKFMIRLPVMA